MSENSHDNLQLRHQNALNIQKYGSSLEKRGKALQESDNQTVKQCGELLENYGFWLQKHAQATLLYLEIKTLDGLIDGYGEAKQAHVNAIYALQQAIAIGNLIKTKFIEIVDLQESKQELLNTTSSNSTQESNIKYLFSINNNDLTRIQERETRILEYRTRIQERETRIQERETQILEYRTRILDWKLRIEKSKLRIK